MKKQALFIILCGLCIQPKASASEEIKLETKVENATVFFKGAQVTRKKQVTLPKGESQIRFVGLSTEIDPQSIQLNASSGVTVLSVNHQKNYMDDLKESEAVSVLRNRITALQHEEQKLNARLEVLASEEKFLNDNRQLAGRDQSISLEALQSTLTYYVNRMEALKMNEIKYKDQIQENQKEVRNLSAQISGMSDKDQPASEVIVKVDSKTAQSVNFELSYLVQKAGWFPSYDVRAKTINEPVHLVYKANVFQNTGVDWDNIHLTFSSSDPNKTGVAPRLATYYLNYGMHAPVYQAGSGIVQGAVLDDTGVGLPGVTVQVKGTTIGTVTGMDGTYSLTLPPNATHLEYSFIGFKTRELPISANVMNISMEEEMMDLDEVVVVGYGSSSALAGQVAGVQLDKRKKPEIKIRGMSSLPTIVVKESVNQTVVEFEVEKPYSVPSDSKHYVVSMKNLELDAQFEYYCVPKIDKDAFLLANVVDWEQYHLLDGEASLYFEGTYTGKTLLNTSLTSDTLTISLGRDKNVVVERVKDKDYSKKQFVGNKKEETRAYTTVIRNMKQESINLTLLDQVPVSMLAEIEVDLSEKSGAQWNEESGELSWHMSVKPMNQKEVKLNYTVKYPKNRSLLIE